jgi:hypothetical protein
MKLPLEYLQQCIDLASSSKICSSDIVRNLISYALLDVVRNVCVGDMLHISGGGTWAKHTQNQGF